MLKIRTISIVTFVLATFAHPQAEAQWDTPPQPPNPAVPGAAQPLNAAQSTIVETPRTEVPLAGYPASRGMDRYALSDAEDRSRRARVGLLATTAIFSAGVVIVVAGAASECNRVERPGTDDIECTDTGDSLIAAGATVMGLSAIGILTTGILLGVRNSQKRKLLRSMRDRDRAKVRWDPTTASFVF